MSGSIYFRKDRRQWIVAWYWQGKRYLITRYKGRLLQQTHPNPKKDQGCIDANRLLAQMQGDVENSVFRIEKYTGKGYTDVIPYFKKWLKTKEKKKPGTTSGYKSYFKTWIKPFFEKNPVQLHEIQLDTLMEMLDFILEGLEKKQENPNPKTELILKIHRKHPGIKSPGLCRLIEKEHGIRISESWIRRVLRHGATPKTSDDQVKNIGKTAFNIMSCFHTFMDYAWRSRRIFEIPPFPKKSDYGLVEPSIKWLPEERQMAIIEAIPAEHRPIFLFLKYHARRPGEACALFKADFNYFDQSFLIRRSISDRQLVESTKTRVEHVIPCHSALVDTIERLLNQDLDSPFLFVNPRARKEGRRYTHESLNNLWKAACRSVGEDIDLYSGLKHSTLSQFYNEKGLSVTDIQDISDHARLESVRRYTKTEIARKRALMEAPNTTPVGKLRKIK